MPPNTLSKSPRHQFNVACATPALFFNDFRLVQANDAFRQYVVVGVADCTHRCLHVCLLQPCAVTQRQVLAAPVAVVRQSIGHPARVQRLLQRIKHQRRLHATHHPPADDITAVHVDNEGGVNVAAARRHVGEVRHPKPIGAARAEVAFDQVR